MATPVFVSHSSRDLKSVRALVEALEARGIGCWLSERDIAAGDNYGDSIVDAIEKASAMVLVFSANADNSDEIKKEIALASQRRITVVPVRIADVTPSKMFRYELATRNWIDLFPDREEGLARLADRLASILALTQNAPPPAPAKKPRPQLAYGLAAAAGLAVVAALAWYAMRPLAPTPPVAAAPTPLASPAPAPSLAAATPTPSAAPSVAAALAPIASPSVVVTPSPLATASPAPTLAAASPQPSAAAVTPTPAATPTAFASSSPTPVPPAPSPIVAVTAAPTAPATPASSLVAATASPSADPVAPAAAAPTPAPSPTLAALAQPAPAPTEAAAPTPAPAAFVPAAPVAPQTPAAGPGALAAKSAAVPIGPAPNVAAGDPGGETFRECEDCPTMVVIPAGKAMLGSPPGEPGRKTGEVAPHEVDIARPFAVARHATTFDEWDACIADGGCNARRPGDYGFGRKNRPVILVSWNDAEAYVDWLKRKTGAPYRLLSEAEWEYAARGCASLKCPYSAFWFGSIRPELAVYDSRFAYDGSPKANAALKTAPADSGAPNPFGLYNMLGNVRQWAADCWNATPPAARSDGAPLLSGDCDERATRGGSWSDQPGDLRAAARSWESIDERSPYIGFRVGRTLTP
jgi:formylglycine-generating enzyme required for sulfatase activity